MNGTAFGAIGILNATAGGIGCSLAIQPKFHATWRWGTGPENLVDRKVSDAVAKTMQPGTAYSAVVTAPFPASRGLKTSSATAAALLRAAGHPEDGLCEAAVLVCRAAGVTITGALDDQMATIFGGVQVTDNRRDLPLASWSPRHHVAVWVPTAQISKADVAKIDNKSIRKAAESLGARLLRDQHALPQVLTQAGKLYYRLYAEAGLPVTDAPVRLALDHGAEGAGISGTGPAVAALFSRRVDLPEVPGGTWHWTEVQPDVRSH